MWKGIRTKTGKTNPFCHHWATLIMMKRKARSMIKALGMDT